MKYLRLLLTIFLILPTLFMISCGDKNLEYSLIQRDDQHIGGNLTFDYDSVTHVATFGGKGETVEYYNEDIARGFNKAGNRVGIKLSAPSSIKDYNTGSATVGDEKIVGGSFYRQVNNEKVGEAVFYPLVDENNRKLELKIIWEDGTVEQTYTILIREETQFASD